MSEVLVYGAASEELTRDASTAYAKVNGGKHKVRKSKSPRLYTMWDPDINGVWPEVCCVVCFVYLLLKHFADACRLVVQSSRRPDIVYNMGTHVLLVEVKVLAVCSADALGTCETDFQ